MLSRLKEELASRWHFYVPASAVLVFIIGLFVFANSMLESVAESRKYDIPETQEYHKERAGNFFLVDFPDKNMRCVYHDWYKDGLSCVYIKPEVTTDSDLDHICAQSCKRCHNGIECDPACFLEECVKR